MTPHTTAKQRTGRGRGTRRGRWRTGARTGADRPASRRACRGGGRRPARPRDRSTSAPAPAASGRRPMAAPTGRTSPTASSTPRPVGALAVAESDPNVIYAGTGETDHPRQRLARRRRLQVDRRRQDLDERRPGAIRATSPRSASIPTTPTSSMSRRSGTPGVRTPSAASSARPTAARPGSRFCSAASAPARSTCRWIPRNPRILYAAFWEAQRTPYSLSSGGPGSGLFKSTDGGDTWTELTASPACPRASGQDRRGRLARQAGPRLGAGRGRGRRLFRSDDGGETWERLSEDRRPAAARLVLHARLRRPAGPGDRVGAQPGAAGSRPTAAAPSRRSRRRTATTTTCGSIRATRSA